jgi:hypothetical protein
MKWYFVCVTCNAKWFANGQLIVCPRCGELTVSTEQFTPPWQDQANSSVNRFPADLSKKAGDETVFLAITRIRSQRT